MARSGRCHCGAFQYELLQDEIVTMNCHCRNCRRANGGAFSTMTPIDTENFRVVAGAEVLQSFQTPTGFRFFCGKCGGRLFTRPDKFPNLTNGQRLTAITSANVYWNGTSVVAEAGGAVPIHAPSPYQPGSSISHWSPVVIPDDATTGSGPTLNAAASPETIGSLTIEAGGTVITAVDAAAQTLTIQTGLVIESGTSDGVLTVDADDIISVGNDLGNQGVVTINSTGATFLWA